VIPCSGQEIPCSAFKISLFLRAGNSRVSGRKCVGIRDEISLELPKSREFPVFFPVSREFGPETGSRETAATAN